MKIKSLINAVEVAANIVIVGAAAKSLADKAFNAIFSSDDDDEDEDDEDDSDEDED